MHGMSLIKIFLPGRRRSKAPDRTQPSQPVKHPNNADTVNERPIQSCTASLDPSPVLQPPRIIDSVTEVRTSSETVSARCVPDKHQPHASAMIELPTDATQTITVQPEATLLAVEQNSSDIRAIPPTKEVGRIIKGSGPSANYNTVLYMIIHLPDGRRKMNLAKLDTAAAIDILSLEILERLELPMEEYHGGDLSPLGDPIRPLGQVTLDWHIKAMSKVYTTTFAILDNQATRGFDALLGSKTIGEVGFYTVNESVWFFD